MKLPKLFDNFKNVIEKVQNMPPKDLNAWKFIIIFLIAADLFGIYWYLKQKVVGGAILLVLIIILAFLLFFSRKNAIPAPPSTSTSPPKPKDDVPSVPVQMKGGKNKKMPEETEVEEKAEEEFKEDSDFGLNIDLGDVGLGDSKDFQNRLDDALGKPLF